MPPSSDLLFVYGTLRPALATGRPRELVEGLEVVGQATVGGVLFDLGGFPGMVFGPGTVHGDLLRITAAERLAALDAYEECEGPHALFRRQLVRARLPGDAQTTAWAYVYAGPIVVAARIADGDYIAYVGAATKPRPGA